MPNIDQTLSLNKQTKIEKKEDSKKSNKELNEKKENN